MLALAYTQLSSGSHQCDYLRPLQQLGVSLGHVITFSEPSPDVSVPTPLAANTRTLGTSSPTFCFNISMHS